MANGTPPPSDIPSGECICTTLPDGTIRIDHAGINRQVIYRITRYLPRVNGYIGEWPD